MSNCQKRHCGCPMYKQKECYRQAFRGIGRRIGLPNPMEKWECTAEVEKTCPDYKPFPPKMTEDQFNEKQAHILSKIPMEFRSAISHKAWEDGHSAGYEEVIIHLTDLVEALQTPIIKFEQRIKMES